jgi:hypothetical protein
MAELLDQIHPGEILREEFMKPMGITARQLAADIYGYGRIISTAASGDASRNLPLTALQSMCPRYKLRK